MFPDLIALGGGKNKTRISGSYPTWTKPGKFIQTTLPASWEICMQVRKQQLELDMEQQTGPKSEKEYVKAVYHHPAYLTYVPSTSCVMPD